MATPRIHPAGPQSGESPMTHLPINHYVSTNTSRSIKPARAWLRAAIADPNLFMIIAFCAIGLLVTLNVMFRFPDFGISVEQLQQF
jgi:hypothetical protein